MWSRQRGFQRAHIQWCSCREDDQQQVVPVCAHYRESIIVHKPYITGQERTAASLRARVLTPIVCTFYSGTTDSILTSCITVVCGMVPAWHPAVGASSAEVRAVEKIIDAPLLSMQDFYFTRLTQMPPELSPLIPPQPPKRD